MWAFFPSFTPVTTHASAGLCTGWQAMFLLYFACLIPNYPSAQA
jgi:hypothetical protein